MGLGQQDVAFVGADSEGQINLGLGVGWNLWKKLDGRASFNFYDGNEAALLKRSFNVGFVYRFASQSSPAIVEREPTDSDGGGVIDSRDRC